jgi:hypothetical protein
MRAIRVSLAALQQRGRGTRGAFQVVPSPEYTPKKKAEDVLNQSKKKKKTQGRKSQVIFAF